MSLCWIAGCPHNNTTILTELNRAQVLGQINLQEQQMHRNLCSSVTEDLTTEKGMQIQVDFDQLPFIITQDVL